MRTMQDYEVPRDYGGTSADVSGTGWVMFAAVLLGLAGLWNFIEGVAAISNAHVYVGNANYVFSDLKTWGWIVLLIGVVQLFVAFGIWAGSNAARWVGIVIVSLNAIAQLLFIPAYPFWALAIFSLDVLVLYGLAAYGGRPTLT